MIRSVTGNNGFAMPYWDWAANRTVPQAFREATYGGQPNPLYVSSRHNNYSIPDIYSGPSVMSSIYGQTNFELFASSRPGGQASTAAAWIKAKGIQGTLEATPHNNIHDKLGGYMPDPHSAKDPIFLMHHGNIDRIWWHWNCSGGVNTSDPLWRNMPFTNHYYNPDGSWATYKPSDLQSVGSLGYSYGPCLVRAQFIAVRQLANPRLAAIFRAGRAAAARPPGTELLALRSRVSGAALEAVGTAPPRSLRDAFSNLAAQRPSARQTSAAQSTSQVVALIHDLTPPSNDVEVLVFAGTGPLPPVSDPSDPHFVTAIGFFGAHAHGHAGVSVSIDLTEHLRTMPAASDQVHVRLVARPTGREDAAVQDTVTRTQIEVVIV